MNRLVQGDVGSGKTVVAVMALFLAVCNGEQGAFMVPTEVLAMQHKESLEEMLAPYGVKIGLLIGSMTAKEKREGKQKLAEGEWDVVVGTHAILQDNVEFADLALVITDEQHRFGVPAARKIDGKRRYTACPCDECDADSTDACPCIVWRYGFVHHGRTSCQPSAHQKLCRGDRLPPTGVPFYERSD